MGGEISCSVPARIGLLGNPSDGYYGQCISLPVWNWQATVTLAPNDSVTLPKNEGLQRIMEPTLRVFERRFGDSGCFEAAVETTIPRQVGLAGSSAIETAFVLSLMAHNDIPLDTLSSRELAELVLKVESEELGVVAGGVSVICCSSSSSWCGRGAGGAVGGLVPVPVEVVAAFRSGTGWCCRCRLVGGGGWLGMGGGRCGGCRRRGCGKRWLAGRPVRCRCPRVSAGVGSDPVLAGSGRRPVPGDRVGAGGGGGEEPGRNLSANRIGNREAKKQLYIYHTNDQKLIRNQ